ncbi:MAG: DEAD/DEAH box helicase family protein [bacterium]
MNLCHDYDTLSRRGIINKDVPRYIESNIKFNLREYQKEAISRFVYYIDNETEKNYPVHLLFNMATGSGKTLIMVANMLHLYKRGYRNFVFFVNRNNIIEKTKGNFVDKSHNKYLFADSIQINYNKIAVTEVNNFETTNNESINIVFTTIQGLHYRLNTPQENSLTYDDFVNKKVALISDEAHHINTLTKTKSQLTKSDKEEINHWEYTINRILHSNRNNILLEYTATVELTHPAIEEKYEDKIIYKYPLKEFRLDGFSKEVKLLKSDSDKNDRVLQAIILSQYRRKVAQYHHVNIKPVLLLKARTIDNSKEYEEQFHKMINSLTREDLLRIRDHSQSQIISRAFQFFNDKNITLENLALEIKEEFGVEKCIAVNSKEESEEKQLVVNNLEDKDNNIRVVFEVSKLDEGWDVLNLYDIVRLDESKGTPSRTISEAQLIGRGARYYPFKLKPEQQLYKRKYDNDPDNELKVLEELYYHSINKSEYISDLREELIKGGIIPANKKRINLEIKESFKQTSLWQSGWVFINKRKKKDNTDVNSLESLNIKKRYKHNLHSGYSSEDYLFIEEEQNISSDRDPVKISRPYELNSFDPRILLKAINGIKFYRFSNLKELFPNLKSKNEFITSNNYLASIEVEVTGTKEGLDNLTIDDKLRIAQSCCQKLADDIMSNYNEYEGTEEFQPVALKKILRNVSYNITTNNDRDSDKQHGESMTNNIKDIFRLNLNNKDWYVYNDNYGTSEEKYFVKFLNNVIDKLEEKYQDIYLIRNERLVQLYTFDKGSPFEPDFILFLKKKDDDRMISYQLFIEPKGEKLIKPDIWKEKFLKEIEEKYELDILADEKNYKLYGLPFYNEGHIDIKRNFEKAFKEKLDIEI